MKKVTAVNISRCLLAGLEVAGILTMAAIAPNSLQLIKMFGAGKRKYKSNSVYRALKRLEKQRCVEIIKEINGKTTIKITEKGRKRLLEYNIDEMKIEVPKHWDKKWRVVSFDIPEKRKKAREALRYKLRDLNFYPIQKSMFILPYQCRDEIDFIAEIFQIKKHLVYFEATNIDNEIKIRNYFNLLP